MKVPGVGAGVARAIDTSSPHNGFAVSGNETVGAYQAIAGVEYALSPALKLGLDYRYLLAHDVNFHVPAAATSTKAGDFNDHAVLLTLRYEFGGPGRARPEPVAAASPPPPPPPVTAAPAPPPPTLPRNYTVYFDLNSATLSESARDVIRQAATTAQQNQATRLTVTGFADTTGTAPYNRRLSERRAAAVRSELVSDGVPADEIVTAGRGQSDLAVPTSNNVREPRNRRVVVIVQGPGS